MQKLISTAVVIACGLVAVAGTPFVRCSHADVLGLQSPKVRVVGPNLEPVPVLNESGRSLQLKVVDNRSQTVAASGWRSDSPDVATVTTSGEARGVAYGFATITAQTSKGDAKCFVAVMRVRTQTGGMVQGDTKSDSAGKVYLSDPVHHVIVRASGLASERWVGTNNQPGFADGQGTSSQFDQPTGLAVDLSSQGGLYVADRMNHCIRKVGFDGRVGTANRASVVVGDAEVPGTTVGPGPFPLEGFRINGPQGVVSTGGNLYVADTENHCIWYADIAHGLVYLVGGKAGEPGFVDGIGTSTRFNLPSGLAINNRGTLLAVADKGNNVVRLIRVGRTADDQLEWRVSTLGVASSGKWRDVATVAETDDLADAIAFSAPRSVSFDGVDNVYVIDGQTATVVTRPEEADPVAVALAEAGSLGTAVSLTVAGTRALVLDGAATSDAQAVYEVTVGAPEITNVTPAFVKLEGGETVVVEGSNFAPESQLTLGDQVVTNYTVESARRVTLVVPYGITAPGTRTLTVATRGGLGQKSLEVRAKSLSELAPGEITTIAGGVPFIGDGGVSVSAAVATPESVAVDGAGNVYVADYYNNRIRRIDATGRITTVAGTGDGGYNGDGIPATSAQLNAPAGVAVDAAGILYIADSSNHRIRRVDVSGLITTVAGTGVATYDGDEKPAISAGLSFPTGMAIDRSGNVFIADNFNHRIRRVDAAGTITTVAGTGDQGYNGDNRLATTASLFRPRTVAFDGAGNLYIADYFNNRVRRVDTSGRIATVAGSSEQGYNGDHRPATTAQLNFAWGIAVTESGELYIADTNNNRIRRVDSDGEITTIAGTGVRGYDGDGGSATSALLSRPLGVSVDPSGNVYIADTENDRVRRIDATGRISLVAGTGLRGYDGDDKPATSATLYSPTAVAVDTSGHVFIADSANNRVRKVDLAGQITTIAGTGESGYDGDNKPATSARLSNPVGVAVDVAGNVFISDSGNRRIRRVDVSGRISTVAGTGEAGYDGDNKPATSARLSYPSGVAVDASGNLFIADAGDDRVRRVDASGRISTVAGTGLEGYNGDSIPAIAAQLSYPRGVALDSSGNLFIADNGNSRIRRVDATGQITTVAGTGERGFSGDGMPATSAQFYFPSGVTVDGAGHLYVADTENSRVRRVDAAGIVVTVAGKGERLYTGDNMPAASAGIDGPSGLAVDGSGNVFIADTRNDAIRVVRQPGAVGGGPAPSISSATYSEARGKLVVRGEGFGATGAVVTVNGLDASSRLRKQTDVRLVLRGTATELGLHSGANQITVTAGGATSVVYVLTL